MPSDAGKSASYPYTVISSGTNSQGNSYDNRTQPCGEAYHYSNNDGFYYYSNSNCSTYHSSSSDGQTYTTPNGDVHKK